MQKFKEVTEDEFVDFIENYKKPLTSGCTAICDPPIRSFRDDSLPTKGQLGDIDYYFDKEVARISMDWISDSGKVDKTNHKKFWKYYILKS